MLNFLRSSILNTPVPTEVKQVYHCFMDISRAKVLYSQYEVADSPTGRYEMLMFHMAALFNQLSITATSNHAAPVSSSTSSTQTSSTQDVIAWKQQAYDLMFADMEVALREMGTGDTGVNRRVKKMAEAFHGRCRAYAQATTGIQAEDNNTDSRPDADSRPDDPTRNNNDLTPATKRTHDDQQALREVIVANVFSSTSTSDAAISGLAQRYLSLVDALSQYENQQIISADPAALERIRFLFLEN